MQKSENGTAVSKITWTPVDRESTGVRFFVRKDFVYSSNFHILFFLRCFHKKLIYPARNTLPILHINFPPRLNRYRCSDSWLYRTHFIGTVLLLLTYNHLKYTRLTTIIIFKDDFEDKKISVWISKWIWFLCLLSF